jgi:hypothetical protein
MTTVTTRTHFRCTYQSCSLLLHEPLPHNDHIGVHIYVDELHECQVLLHTDLGCTLPFLFPLHTSTPNQIFAPMPSTCLAFSFIVNLSILVLLIVFWCGSWATIHLIDLFKETAPRRLKLDHLY